MGDFLISIIKTIVAVLLLPLVVACAQTFWEHLSGYSASSDAEFFLYGAISFLIVFLFLYRFWGPYELGQKISLSIFRFLAPLDKLLAHFFPFYLIILFVAFVTVRRFLGLTTYDHYFLFFLGFILSMQTLQSAQELQEQESQSFKFAYLLVLFLAILVNFSFIVLGMDLVYGKLTFMKFFDSTLTASQGLYVDWGKKVLMLP